MHEHEDRLAASMRWALENEADPAIAAADWLARDLAPQYASALELITDPAVTLDVLRGAKSAFKTMRVVGETAADRRLAARLYGATIAAGLVRHRTRISGQSDGALQRAFSGLLSDEGTPSDLRELASAALRQLGRSSTP